MDDLFAVFFDGLPDIETDVYTVISSLLIVGFIILGIVVIYRAFQAVGVFRREESEERD